ncbi:ankyrin repeat-containing domain protein [Ustulina deusta]|nr:ankyrin repeat-containing domain protein [Ustulina deusta]
MNGQFDIVEMLIESRTDDLGVNYDLALQAAVENGHPDILTLAATIGHADVVKILLENRADVNKVTERGTALSAAACNGHLDIVKILLQNGATIHRGADRGIVLLAAVENGDLDIIDKLIRAGVTVNAELVSRADVKAEDANSYTTLDIAH